MEKIDLLIDEMNDLLFKVVIEGAGGEAKVRFVMENGGMMVSFPGKSVGHGEIRVEIPELRKVLKEGRYNGHLEVIADDRFFEPLHVDIDLKAGIAVSTAQVVSVNESRKRQGVSVSASVEHEERKAPPEKKALVEKRAAPISPVVVRQTKKEEVPGDMTDEFTRMVRDIIRQGK